MRHKFSLFLKMFSVASAFVFFGSIGNIGALGNPINNARTCGVARNEYIARDSRELAIYANNANENDQITLANDIRLDTKVNFKVSVSLNLNGYTIFVDDDNEIVIGQKDFSHIEKETVVHPEYYTWEKEVKIIEHPGDIPPTKEEKLVRVWHPATFETRYKNIYDYKDNVDVVIRNGSIKKLKGKNGKNGEKDCWIKYSGQAGETPSAPIRVVSGTVRFCRVCVRGGDGGNGGNGKYQALLHIVLGGGNAGNGGNGGNGGHAIYLERKECKVKQDQYSDISSGTPGQPGKAGKSNKNYWVYSGSEGKKGKKGGKLKPIFTNKQAL